jgi:hypothetical protein
MNFEIHVVPYILLIFTTALYNDVIPTDLADRFASSIPWPATKLLNQRIASHLVKTIDKYELFTTVDYDISNVKYFVDRDTIDGLGKAGFRTHLGIDGSGRTELFLRTAGGYYIGMSLLRFISLSIYA